MRTAQGKLPVMMASALFTVLATLGCRDGTNPMTAARTAALIPDDPAMSQVTFTQEVCGPVPATLVITENTRLTCDLECAETTGPCIQFGKDNITLALNGFTMRGTANAPANCAPTSAGPAWDGISTAGFDRVKVRGPGMVEKFRRHGIFMAQTDDAIIEHVTSNYNCYSGILMNASHENLLSENVSVRNASASGATPCGGNCLVNSNGNRIRRNHFHGNGSLAPGAPLANPNDFGVGLLFTSSDNIIEENSIGGNINGVLLFQGATGNLIRRNLIAGNPPSQLAPTAGTPVGVDIRDASPSGANTFEDNHCITYEGASFESGSNASRTNDGTPGRPCPNFPRARGHH
jgi:hypothetical protein